MDLSVSDIAKPCPICGCSKILIEAPEDSDYIYSLKIKCENCGLNGYMCFGTKKVPFDEGAWKLLDYWNNRKEI